jgi:Flp pilus assembly CpaE family ATPase
MGGPVRVVGDLAGAARMLSEDPTETLVVIGPQADLDQALTFSARCRADRPAVGVILVRPVVDVTTLTKALRAGVREVVPAGEPTALAEACVRSRELSWRAATGTVTVDHQPQPEGKVVTVFSAKGGCGKTTLALNLAVGLATSASRRVCLVDLDLAFGDIAIILQLDPARTIVQGIGMVGHLDATGAVSLLTPYRQGMDTLLAPVEPGAAEKIPPALVTELLTVLRRMYDFVIVDTPSQFSEHVLAAMDASQHHVLLTTPDVPALKNLRVTLDMLDLLSYPTGIRSVVLNRSDSKVGLTTEDVERAVRSPIAARVPSSRDVPISINKGTPITLSSPNHPVSEAIVQFASQHLLGERVLARSGGLSKLRMRRRSG